MPKVSLAPDYYVAVMGDNVRAEAMKIISNLRMKYNVETDVMRRSLNKQLSYAVSIGAKKLVVIGDNEIKSGRVKVKDMKTRQETEMNISEL
jgi:histidyl-tRNA synthetase